MIVIFVCCEYGLYNWHQAPALASVAVVAAVDAIFQTRPVGVSLTLPGLLLSLDTQAQDITTSLR